MTLPLLSGRRALGLSCRLFSSLSQSLLSTVGGTEGTVGAHGALADVGTDSAISMSCGRG